MRRSGGNASLGLPVASLLNGHAGVKSSSALASDAPEQFPWWEPWDLQRPKTRSSQCCARAARANADDGCNEDSEAHMHPDHNEHERHSNSQGKQAAPSPASQGDRHRRASTGAGVDHLHDEAQQPIEASVEPSSGPNKRRRVNERDAVVDAVADNDWLRSLTASALTEEVQFRQRCVLHALAGRPPEPQHSLAATPGEASADGELLLEAVCASSVCGLLEPSDSVSGCTQQRNTRTHAFVGQFCQTWRCPGAGSTKRGSIGGVSLELLGVHELRAALDRSRSVLASRRSQQEQQSDTQAGGFF